MQLMLAWIFESIQTLVNISGGKSMIAYYQSLLIEEYSVEPERIIVDDWE